MIRLPLLDPDAPASFPDPRQALTEPNGLLAFGGDLSPTRLLAAYGKGIFPWFSDGEPILWWSPDPRCVLHTQDLRMNRSLRRQLADKHWHLTLVIPAELVTLFMVALMANHDRRSEQALHRKVDALATALAAVIEGPAGDEAKRHANELRAAVGLEDRESTDDS